MVRFTVHNLGEHCVDEMIVSGPFKEVVMELVNLFLATYTGKPNSDLDYDFAQYVIKMSSGQGEILEHHPLKPTDLRKIH